MWKYRREWFKSLLETILYMKKFSVDEDICLLSRYLLNMFPIKTYLIEQNLKLGNSLQVNEESQFSLRKLTVFLSRLSLRSLLAASFFVYIIFMYTVDLVTRESN